jgi:CHAT domain-containing protein/cytochrome c-type biogenesis protein CcmH/NrfG
LEHPNQHVAPAELARLLEEARCLAQGRPGTGPDVMAMHRHLAVCGACREQFEELAELERQFMHLRPVETSQTLADCPDTRVWPEIVVGLPQPEDTLLYVEHAGVCSHCGPLLRKAVAELAPLNRELTEEERKQIATLDSATASWQQQLAHRIAAIPVSTMDRESAPWSRYRMGFPRQVLAGVALLAVVGVGSWIVFRQVQLRHQPAAAESMLARAYTKKRTLELRIAGAAYAPINLTRGEAGSFANSPKELLSAEALIASQLESQPTNPAWLQAQAEADMLEGKYDPAVQALRHAVELEPQSPALLTDLASAYFQRGESQDKKDDLAAAYENLSKALALQPDDPVALFNRAVVGEHLFLYHQALDDWDHYLRVDPASQWAQEARIHSDAVRTKLKDHQSQATPPSAERLIEVASGSSPPTDVDQRIEEYLDLAIRSWLPAAFPDRGNEVGTNKGQTDAAKLNGDPRALQALFFLADLASQHHGDHWLADLLRGSSAPHFPQAVAALARASTADLSGEYEVSSQQGQIAERLFRASGNAAGVLRAQFDQTFAAQMERRSEDCRRTATAALTESESQSYTWLQIQFGLEKSVCSGLMGDIGTTNDSVVRAVQRAEQNAYGGLYLRAIGFAAGDQSINGDPLRGLKLASAGLAKFWSGQFPAMRGYNLYTELTLSAEVAGRSNLRMAALGEAVALIDSNDNLLMRAWAHDAMADAATQVRLPDVARRQYAEAERLFAAAPRTEATRNYEIETKIRTAQLDARGGRFEDAIAQLTAIQDQVRPLSNNYLVQMFYSTLGEVQLGRNRNSEAEQALRSALALAEQSLATLGSESKRRSWTKDAAPVYLALIEAELTQGRSEEALDTYEWYLAAPLRLAGDSGAQPSQRRTLSRTTTNPPTPEPSRLESRLPLLTKETALTYAVLPEGLAIWVYDDRGINAHWIPKPTEGLREVAERFHDLSSDPASELSALRRDARSLYETLIAPVEQHFAPGRTLVIEAEGWLAQVPFEALLDAKDHFLVERAPIVHSLGQDSEERLRVGTGISADSPALVVGSAASLPTEGLMPLPGVGAEAETVAASFHSAHVLEGREATMSSVRSKLPGAAVFHFAGHALATPGRTGLMLEGKSPDGQTNTLRLLDADTVRQLHLQSLQLAVLSACSTASGSGESSGFDSVTDAFLRAGVPHVVASRWAVGSAETQEFVQDFYRNALLGQSIPDAIRLTSLKLLAGRDTSHPYYWSAFAAYGRP